MDPIIRLDPQCMACLLRNYAGAYPADADETQKIAYMQSVLRMIADAPLDWGAPVLVSRIKRLRGEMFGVREDYEAVKRHFNALMLARQEEIEARILASADPLRTAIQYAMIGNYIDFGALENVEEQALGALLAQPERFPVSEAEYAALRRSLGGAASLVCLTDNCGEIVFDKLLLRTIMRLYPQITPTVIVRGGPVLNDATLEDAQQVGLCGEMRVIGNGSDVAGTHLEALGEQAAEAVRAADVIIAKGQANHETLRHCGMNVYYIFLCKCDMFAKRFGVERFSGVLVHDSRC